MACAIGDAKLIFINRMCQCGEGALCIAAQRVLTQHNAPHRKPGLSSLSAVPMPCLPDTPHMDVRARVHASWCPHWVKWTGGGDGVGGTLRNPGCSFGTNGTPKKNTDYSTTARALQRPAKPPRTQTTPTEQPTPQGPDAVSNSRAGKPPPPPRYGIRMLSGTPHAAGHHVAQHKAAEQQKSEHNALQ